MTKLNPPFWGTKIIDNINFHDYVSLINKEALFSSRWQFRQGQTTEEWQKLKEEKIEPIYENIMTLCETHQILEPKIVYGYFECKNEANILFIYDEQKRVCRCDFPRQRQSPNLCLADFFEEGFVIMQLVTVGDKIIKEGAKLFAAKNYSQLFYLKGFAAEAAEALAEYSQRTIRQEMQIPAEQGCRFSFGYPACPDLFCQKIIFDLLQGSRIGVKLSETMQLIPEYSTSALVSFSPQARLFRP